VNGERKNIVLNIAIDGVVHEAQPDEFLIDLINRAGGSVPHVCYHPQLGPVQTCDTCMVEVNGHLLRSCATKVADGMKISAKSAKASAAQVPQDLANVIGGISGDALLVSRPAEVESASSL
jgi:predicted molibdopterin-dependent oxidoreductase YjgC